ncbi:MAG: hypothetical protein JW982_06970 [Spirochaetes bacterium]|nr:hypothetical protein [Spirochaetota bacterium]
MKKIFLFTVINVIFLISGCATVPLQDGYCGQPVLAAKHNPDMDGALEKNSKILVILPAESNEFISSEEMESVIRKVLTSGNLNSYNFIIGKEIDPLLKSKNLRSKYEFIRTGGALEHASDKTVKEIKNFMSALGIRYIFFPVITDYYVDELKVDVEVAGRDHDWPEFSVTEMQHLSTIYLSMKMYKSNGSFSKVFSVTEEFSQNYDTAHTIKIKKIEVERENKRRIAENERREEEFDRENEEKSKKRRSGAEKVFDNIGIILGYDKIDMLDISSIINNSKVQSERITGSQLMEKAMTGINNDFYSMFDGMTVSGNTINGSGEFRFINGDVCKGTWIDSEASGMCRYQYSDGSYYDGEFLKGMPNGTGVFKSAAGNIYSGTYVSGNMYGEGVWTIVKGDGIYVNMDGVVRDYDNTPKGFEKDYWKVIAKGKYSAFCENGVIVKVKKIK